MKIQVGEIEYELPRQPDKKDIDGYDLPKKQQRFARVIPPTNFSELPLQEQVDFLAREIKRRIDGYWFMCNGEPTYITGDHYFYLNYWFIDADNEDGYPEYRSADRLEYYFSDYCDKDMQCFGYMYLTKRRDGKTEKNIAKMYNRTSRTPGKHSGLQSLTAKDAQKNLFTDRLIRSWKKMFHEFKPLDDGKSDPVTALRWFEPSKTSSKRKKKEYEKALDSWIDWAPTKESAYQGKKLLSVLLDEPATVEEMDVINWWSTTRKTLTLGPKVIGKAWLPTTIETMNKKGGQSFMELWQKSDIKEKDANGRTKSGMYRYFKPAFDGLEGFIDEYGNSLIEEAKQFLLNEREGADESDLPMLKRQFPFTAEEAFDIVVGNTWEEDVKQILAHVRNDVIREKPDISYVKLFEMAGEVKITNFKPQEGLVKIYEHPRPDVKYIVGFDGSASDKQTGSDKGSKVAITVLKGFEGIDKINYTPVATYSLRPERMEDAYQTILLVCRHYGQYGNLKIIGEANAGQASPVVAYFANRGFLKFIMKRPKTLGFNFNDKTDKYWIYRSSDVKTTQIILANRFIRRYGQNIKILSLLEDLINMGSKNTDEADSFLMAILGFGDFENIQEKAERTRTKMVPMRKRDNLGRTIIVWKSVNV